MYEIFKHGRFYRTFKADCKVCGCVFTYEGNADMHIIRSGLVIDGTPHAKVVVYCPECKQDVVIKDDIELENY